MTKKYFNNMPDVDIKAIKQSSHHYNPAFVQSRFLNLWNRIYNGADNGGGVLSVGDVNLNYVCLGDSVGTAKAYPLRDFFYNKFGKRGTVYQNTPAVSGGGYNHSDVSETEYWFNGQWSGIDGGSGTVTFNEGGGGYSGDTLKVYYLKGPSFGHLKVQKSINGIAGTFNDIVGFTDVDCYNEEIVADVLEITTDSNDATVPRITGISGDVVVLFATMEASALSGAMFYNFAEGGLGWDKASLTVSTIVSPVFTEIQADFTTLEFKEGYSHTWVEDYVIDFLDMLNNAYAKTDWAFIGSTPQSINDEYNVSANAALKVYAEDNNYFYFDGYNALIDYDTMVDIGWEGDGTHPDDKASFFLASILIKTMGLYDVFMRVSTFDVNNDETRSKLFNIAGYSAGINVGSIDNNGDNDVLYKTIRNHILQLVDGTTMTEFSTGGINMAGGNPQLKKNGVNFLLDNFRSGSCGAANSVCVGDGTSAKPKWVAGDSGSFTTADGKTITVVGGVITSIV